MEYFNRAIRLLSTSVLLCFTLSFDVSEPKKKIFMDFYYGMTEREYYVTEKKLIDQWSLSANGKRTYYVYQDKRDRVIGYGFLEPVFDKGRLIGVALLINNQNNTGRIGDCYPLYDLDFIEGIRGFYTIKYGTPKYREGSHSDGSSYKEFGWNNIVLHYYSLFSKTVNKEIYCCTVYYR